MHVFGRRSFLQANAAALALGLLPRRHTFRQDPAGVSYLIRYDTDTAGRVVITMTPPPQSGAVQLVFPRSIPMGYGVAPYADFVEGVRGWSKTGERLPVARLEGPRWLIGREGAVLDHLRYVVNVQRMEQQILSASDSSRSRYGYLSLLGYSVLGYLDGLERLPVTWKFARRWGGRCSRHWLRRQRPGRDRSPSTRLISTPRPTGRSSWAPTCR